MIETANPQSEEASVMRSSLVPGMLNMLAYNLNRGTENVHLFEAASTFEAAASTVSELKRVSLTATGSALSSSVHQSGRPISFFDVKGDVESLLREFQYVSLYYDAARPSTTTPGAPLAR